MQNIFAVKEGNATFDAVYIIGTLLAMIYGCNDKVLRGNESWYKHTNMSHSRILS